jgi:cysteine desulfuration protein SufE
MNAKNMNIQEIVDNFALFDDWEDKYRYLIDLGRTLPPMPEALKTDENKVRGCMSQVWMVLKWDQSGKLAMEADSDAQIVRGLVAVLRIIYNGETAENIKKVDVERIFRSLGLDQHLSPNRRNGFYAMVERIGAFIACGK